MPKFFCDYCDVYLTHDSMSVRKAHNSGRNHLRNVIDYYQQIGHEKAQSVIDSITSSYAAEGQAHNNPMLPHNQPGGMGAFPPVAGMPAFPFPGGMPPPGFPALPGASSGAPGAAGAPPTAAFPQGMVPPPPRPGSNFSLPPFPPPINATAGPGSTNTPPLPGIAGGLPFPPPPGGLPFPPPGGVAGAAGGVPPNFQFPPAGFPGMPPFNSPAAAGGPPGGEKR